MLNRNLWLLPRKARVSLAAAALLAASGAIAGIGLAVGHAASSASAKAEGAKASVAAIPAPQTQPGNSVLIARGKYLTAAADCMPCHSAPGRPAYSGGLSMVTPFGTIYSPNITPDRRTGIGTWNNHKLWDALHHGISPGHSWFGLPNYIYPAMPYTSYSKLSYQDVVAIKAYLDTLKPIHASPHPNQMSFPFNIRAILLGWRIFEFNPHPMRYGKNWSPAVRNGAYLAEALGHCGECHSQRNILFGVKRSKAYAGAAVVGESWYAPNISSAKHDGVGGWSKQELVSYLHDGGNMAQGSVFGPMKAVVDYSLSQIPKSDVADIADYLQQATKPQEQPKGKNLKSADLKLGATLYAANCQGCHQATGKGVANVFPNLAGNQAVWGGPPHNVISAILGGLGPWHPNGAPMPAFGSALDDQQIAAVTNYVRTAWGNPGAANTRPSDVLAMRATDPPTAIALADADYLNLPPIASAAARRFGCPLVSGSGDANLLADPGSGWMSVMRDATPETLPNRTRMLIQAVKANDSTISANQITNYLIAAYCPVVAQQGGMSAGEKNAALNRFIAGAQTEIAKAGG